jgi:predicted ArsR family transcriptional regulator
MRSSQQHHALAGQTRGRLLAVLRQAPGPMRVTDLATAVRLHANTVREHLQLLADAGLVRRETAPSSGRGRPAIRYSIDRDTLDPDALPYATLSRVLADQLAGLPDAAAAARGAGRRWGRAMASDAAAAPTRDEALARIVAILDDAGFDPETPTGPDPDTTVRLRRCPFGTLPVGREAIVCGVHLGLMQGALRELGAPLDAIRLEPFVAPDLCVAHLADRDDA